MYNFSIFINYLSRYDRLIFTEISPIRHFIKFRTLTKSLELKNFDIDIFSTKDSSFYSM